MTQPAKIGEEVLGEETRQFIERQARFIVQDAMHDGEPLDQARQAFLDAFDREAGK